MTEEWIDALIPEFNKLYFCKLQRWLKKEREAGKEIYPPEEEVLRAFQFKPPHETNVVIVGQDPYHDPRMANGLAFSVPEGYGIPPSLLNIFKELKEDLGHRVPNHGDLTSWAKQGILLLNTVLTVERDQACSHAEKGWERFTDAAIRFLNRNTRKTVFILWGKHAQQKQTLINNPSHLVLQSTHPSPFSAYTHSQNQIAFMGSRPFSSANQFLIKANKKPINWQII